RHHPPRLCPDPPEPPADTYGRPFWLAFTANLLVATAVALLYRYADLITYLDGTEFHLGWIVGVGMVGSLSMRLLLGWAIDSHGARRVWLICLVAFSLSCFAHLWVTSCSGPAIYLLRIVYASSIAGVFGAALTWVSGRVSITRMAELIGMLGAAGFAAMVVGAILGDYLLGTETIGAEQIQRMFLAAGMLGIVAMLFAFLATRGSLPPARRRRPPVTLVLVRYNPGMILLVSVALGMALSVPGSFLRPFTVELGIPHMATFFTAYASTAFVARVVASRLCERLGLRRVIFLGLAILIVGLLLFLPVTNVWQLLVPGVIFGIGHALVFPPLAALGSQSFPQRYRGLAIMLILAASDLGVLVGAPLAGAILQYSGGFGLPPYPTMFVTMAGALAVAGVFYATAGRREQPRRRRRVAPVRRRRLSAPPIAVPEVVEAATTMTAQRP
ncbi:MAG: MFS transporter, partial [Planctomycetia bacterium]|nr:MFS transporter [Planctomycetia bacterium]